MTKEDIVKAAFKVWGRDLYRTSSLSQVARELGVSKPALYRHFENKEALIQAMHNVFFDDFAALLKEGYEKAKSGGTRQENYLNIMRTIAEYYIRKREIFVFSLIRVYCRSEKDNIRKEFLRRGVDFELFTTGKSETQAFPSNFHLIMATLIFWVSQYHQENLENFRNRQEIPAETPDNEQVKLILAEIESRIRRGLDLSAEKIAALDYERLEQQVNERINGKISDNMDENALLKAVAGAVAEAGPWEVSMEMVARRSGLSKSGLYAHFKNKQDMLEKLLMSEFTGILNSAKTQIETSLVPEEQLYLGIISIVDYLRHRPEFFLAMEWIKTRKLDLNKTALAKIQYTIGDIKLEAVKKQDQQWLILTAQWIFFMVISILTWGPQTKPQVPNESFRCLFRFIAQGLEGMKNEV